jgi:hypothetical protein
MPNRLEQPADSLLDGTEVEIRHIYRTVITKNQIDFSGGKLNGRNRGLALVTCSSFEP